MSEPRFDVVFGEHGPYIDYHDCEEEACYGPYASHGFTWEEVKEELIAWHERQITCLKSLSYKDWALENVEENEADEEILSRIKVRMDENYWWE